MKQNFILIAICCFLAACAFYAEPEAVPSYEVRQKYLNKVPGDFALYIDGSAMETKSRLSSRRCYDWTFPLKGKEPFELSTYSTFVPLFQGVELLEFPIERQDVLQEKGLKAQLIVKAEDVNTTLKDALGYWDKTVEITVEMVGTVRVIPNEGEPFERTFPVTVKRKADGSVSCKAVSYELMQVAEEAIKDLMTVMGEAVANSRDLRDL